MHICNLLISLFTLIFCKQINHKINISVFHTNNSLKIVGRYNEDSEEKSVSRDRERWEFLITGKEIGVS